MRPSAALALLIPATLMGCASQQTLDTQAATVNQRLDAMALAQERLAGAQQSLEARLARLESEQALVAGRLGQDAPASAALGREIDRLRAEAAAAQSALATLAGRVDSQAGQAAAAQSALNSLTSKLDSQAAQIAQVQETAADAVKIARDSRLVSGKVVDTLLLNESMVMYGYEAPELTAQGRAALDKLIAGVKPKLPHVFVEIVGYTDSLSLDSQNRRIALERAESVRRYLHETGGIPLDRMSTISYGDLKPVSSSASFEGRSQNRRVLVQVLK